MNKETVKHTMTIEVEILVEDWIDFLTCHSDIFGTNHCGYWARGIESDATGWLVWEDDEKCRHGREPDRQAAVAAWRAGEALPEHWYRLDRDAAIKAWCEGVKRGGVKWFDNADANDYDVVIQLALLGEIKYG